MTKAASAEGAGGPRSPEATKAPALRETAGRPAGIGVPALQNGNGTAAGGDRCPRPTEREGHGGRRGSVSPPYSERLAMAVAVV